MPTVQTPQRRQSRPRNADRPAPATTTVQTPQCRPSGPRNADRPDPATTPVQTPQSQQTSSVIAGLTRSLPLSQNCTAHSRAAQCFPSKSLCSNEPERLFDNRAKDSYGICNSLFVYIRSCRERPEALPRRIPASNSRSLLPEGWREGDAGRVREACAEDARRGAGRLRVVQRHCCVSGNSVVVSHATALLRVTQQRCCESCNSVVASHATALLCIMQ
jgi:hypothetical protein